MIKKLHSSLLLIRHGLNNSMIYHFNSLNKIYLNILHLVKEQCRDHSEDIGFLQTQVSNLTSKLNSVSDDIPSLNK